MAAHASLLVAHETTSVLLTQPKLVVRFTPRAIVTEAARILRLRVHLSRSFAWRRHEGLLTLKLGDDAGSHAERHPRRKRRKGTPGRNGNGGQLRGTDRVLDTLIRERVARDNAERGEQQ